MSAGAPWSVKGIDPKAREVAKDLARRSGMTLGEWLNHIILEDDGPEDVTSEAQLSERPRRAADARPKLRLAPDPGAPELARIAFALDRLTDRIEASETRTGLAINGVEHSVRQALARIETAEREQQASAHRLEGLLAEASAEQSYNGERIRRLEADGGPRSAEALRMIEARLTQTPPESLVEAVLARLGDRLAMAEARTAAAVDDLKRSLAALDRRLGDAERRADPEPRFAALADTLARRVEAVRAEVANSLAGSGGAAYEARFAELTDRVQDAERRSTLAVEAIGRQVLAMAEAVSRKLSDVDHRGAEAIDQVGSEVARIAGAVELRLARAEQSQAEAFGRFETELARLTASTETTPAPVVAGYPAAETTAAEPATDARTDIEPESQPRFTAAALGPEILSRAEVETEFATADDVLDPPWRRLDLGAPEIDVPDAFAPIDEALDDELFEPERAQAGPELSTREVIERARAAARAAQVSEEAAQDLDAVAARVRAADVRARLGTRAASGRLFQGFAVKPRRAPNSPLQTALMVAGGAAFLSVGAAGLTLMQSGSGPGSGTSQQAALPAQPRAAMALGPASMATRPAPPPPDAAFEAVRAEVETSTPGALDRLRTMAKAGHAPALLYLAQLYDDGAAGLPQDLVEARRLTTQAADAGDVRAMHNLGVYLFRGEGGVQDLPGAAQWFRKAAAAGVVESQYNLGLLYQSGSGVEQDASQARYWFRLAAARGDAEARNALAALKPTATQPVQR
jgi:localization factor PodJL